MEETRIAVSTAAGTEQKIKDINDQMEESSRGTNHEFTYYPLPVPVSFFSLISTS